MLLERWLPPAHDLCSYMLPSLGLELALDRLKELCQLSTPRGLIFQSLKNHLKLHVQDHDEHQHQYEEGDTIPSSTMLCVLCNRQHDVYGLAVCESSRGWIAHSMLADEQVLMASQALDGVRKTKRDCACSLTACVSTGRAHLVIVLDQLCFRCAAVLILLPKASYV